MFLCMYQCNSFTRETPSNLNIVQGCVVVHVSRALFGLKIHSFSVKISAEAEIHAFKANENK